MKTYFKEWMNENGYTVAEVGEKTGISPKILQKWIDKVTTPSISQLSIIVDKYSVSLDTLVFGHATVDDSDDLTEEDIRLYKSMTEHGHQEDSDDKSDDPGKSIKILLHIGSWMKKLGVDAHEIFHKTGIPVEYITKWVNNEDNPSVAQLLAISQVLGISVDDLINSEPDKYLERFISDHIFETRDYKKCVRFMNYCEKEGISADGLVVKTLQGVIYSVRYNTTFPLSLKDLIYATSIVFRDPKEALKGKARLRGMEVVDFSK